MKRNASRSGLDDAAAAGAGRSSAADLHLKMSKKIAQLTKVIYHLNTKNEDHEIEIRDLISKHNAEIEKVRPRWNGAKAPPRANRSGVPPRAARGCCCEGHTARAVQHGCTF